MRLAPFLVLLFFLPPAFAHSAGENALTVHVARGKLVRVMKEIALSIGEIRGEFPQLKKWREAKIFSDRIEYHDPRCEILIVARQSPVLGGDPENPSELKVGVYLKMKAFGKKGELLKQTLLEIVGKHFRIIRNLKS